MKRKDRIIFQKVIAYINDTIRYVAGYDFDSFMNDTKTISACAFVVMQIGEIIKEVTQETQTAYSEIPWNSIRGMRNRIVHDYENIDVTVLWGTIQRSLPELSRQLDKILYQQVENTNILYSESYEDEPEP
ncbi:MAG: HepT-like ribonuclease domain-containing protein [Oscillospiraceae bacterium]|nr:HepT-like ribonuclease domain-containing protein [Oscillospiraceae bacterium]